YGANAAAAAYPLRVGSQITQARLAGFLDDRGLLPGASGTSMASSAGGGAGCCPWGTGWSGTADGMHPVPACKICDRCGEAGGEAPDRESDVWQPTDHQSAPTTEDPPDLHQLVHQRLWTAAHILGPNPKIRCDHGLIRTSWWVLLPTTDQKVGSSNLFGRATLSCGDSCSSSPVWTVVVMWLPRGCHGR